MWKTQHQSWIVSGSCFLPLAPSMVTRFGWVAQPWHPSLDTALVFVLQLQVWASEYLNLHCQKGEKTRTNLALVGSSHDMWVQKFFPISIWAEAKRQRPESEVKVGILHLGVHPRGNAESRSQVIQANMGWVNRGERMEVSSKNKERQRRPGHWGGPWPGVTNKWAIAQWASH